MSIDILAILPPESKEIVNDALNFPVMVEIVPLDFWQQIKDKTDGYEMLLSHKGKKLNLIVFIWSNTSKEYYLEVFDGRTHKLQSRNSKAIK